MSLREYARSDLNEAVVDEESAIDDALSDIVEDVLTENDIVVSEDCTSERIEVIKDERRGEARDINANFSVFTSRGKIGDGKCLANLWCEKGTCAINKVRLLIDDSVVGRIRRSCGR